ncbi:hypothetical protein ACTFIW_012264 [Dictyostelium discoideum]
MYDPICELPTPECLNNVCVYESIPNCCHSSIDCAVVFAPCEKSYFCNPTNQCELKVKKIAKVEFVLQPNHECKIDEFDKQCCVKIECDDICDLNCGRGFE